MKPAIASLVLILALAAPAAARDVSEEEIRALAKEMIADSGAYSVLCEQYQPNYPIQMRIAAATGIPAEEMPAVLERTRLIAVELKKQPLDAVCKEALQKYGPDGTAFKELLLPK